VGGTALPAPATIGNELQEAEVLLSAGATLGEVRKGEVYWLLLRTLGGCCELQSEALREPRQIVYVGNPTGGILTAV
jgi:hypothetical protein